jgi:hypothetical protein
LLTAARHRWASSWAAAIVTPYVRSLVGERPLPELIVQMPFVVQLHVAAAVAAIALLPFTSLGLALLAAAHRAASALLSPAVAVGNAVERRMGILSPATWLWPEEEPVVALSSSQLLSDHHEASPLGSPAAALGAKAPDDLLINATEGP